MRNSLHNHRVLNVRDEARASQIAYAIIRNKKYSDVEPSVKDKHLLPTNKIAHMIKKHGGPNITHNTAGMQFSIPDIEKNILKWIKDSFPKSVIYSYGPDNKYNKIDIIT